jgi:hypothetical protein
VRKGPQGNDVGETTYVPTPDQAVDAYRDWYIQDLRRPRTLRVGAMLAAIIAIVNSVASWAEGDTASRILMTSVGGAILGPVLVCAIWGANYFLIPWRMRRLLRQQRVKEGPHRWRWEPEGLALTSPNGQVSYAWTELHRLVEGRHAYLLFFNDAQYLALPREALDPMQDDEFRGMWRACGGARS